MWVAVDQSADRFIKYDEELLAHKENNLFEEAIYRF